MRKRWVWDKLVPNRRSSRIAKLALNLFHFYHTIVMMTIIKVLKSSRKIKIDHTCLIFLHFLWFKNLKLQSQKTPKKAIKTIYKNGDNGGGGGGYGWSLGGVVDDDSE